MSREEVSGIAKAAERTRRHSRASLKVLLPTAAALGAGAAVAIGQIPSSGGTITGCYQNVPAGVNGADYQYGTLRVIDPSQTTATDTHVYSCDASTEHTITWNQQGPTGVQGPDGPQGPTGPQGQTGEQGAPATIVPESTLTLQSSRQYEIYIQLDGVPGEFKKNGLNGAELVKEFDLGGAGELTGDKVVTIRSFDIVKQGQDPATYTLQHDFVTGKKIDQGVVVVFENSKGKLVEVGRYGLQDIVVSGYKVSTSGDTPTETVSFNFGKVKTTLGSGHDKLTTGWSTGKSIGGFNLMTAKKT